MVWLDADLQWQAPASGRPGRPAMLSDAAIQFCLTLKCMFGLGLRQVTGLAESLIKLARLGWGVPDYSTLSRRQKTLSVAIAARRSSAGLHLLIDSTGVKIGLRRLEDEEARGRLSPAVAQGAPGHRCSDLGDPCHRDHGQRRWRCTDAAYDTKACHEAIASRQAAAIIPTRKNAKPWADDKTGAWARNEILRATRRLGRSIWKKWSGYHRRSLVVETKMGCVKRLIGRTRDGSGLRASGD